MNIKPKFILKNTEPFKHGIQVKVGRNVSSQVQQEFDCHFHNLHHDTEYYHTFYCLHPGYLASSHQMGIDAHSVHIYGNLSLEYSDRNLSEVFKIYPYPGNSKFGYIVLLLNV